MAKLVFEDSHAAAAARAWIYSHNFVSLLNEQPLDVAKLDCFLDTRRTLKIIGCVFLEALVQRTGSSYPRGYEPPVALTVQQSSLILERKDILGRIGYAFPQLPVYDLL